MTENTMKNSYQAMQVREAGKLELVERPMPTPGSGEVVIQIEACGICGADVNDIETLKPNLATPRAPGHEVVGRILKVGVNTPSRWKVGQRVGVGRLGGHCNECEQCRRGEFQLCREQAFVGSSQDGGYAEVMVARATGLVLIPDELNSKEAAPMLCAGIATFNALKKSGAEAGDTIAIHGIGGLGHLAIQYAHNMGFKVIAVGRGQDIEADALNLGAHVYIDSNTEDALAVLLKEGGIKVLISTTGNVEAISALLPAVVPQGRVLQLAAGKDPLSLPLVYLIGGERSVMGSITGSAYENERGLNFSVLRGIRPMIETMPFTKANEAYQKMKSGEAKFRIVLTM